MPDNAIPLELRWDGVSRRDDLPLRTPYGDACRKRDAVQAVRDRFYRRWLALVAEMEAEIDRIKRDGA